MNKNKCISGKNAYSTEDDAKKAAEIGIFLSKEKKLCLHVYRCIDCYQYHLTSSQRKTPSNNRRR